MRLTLPLLACLAAPALAEHTLTPEPHEAQTRFGLIAIEEAGTGFRITRDGATVAETFSSPSIHSVTEGEGLDWVLVSLWQGQPDCERVFLALTLTADATVTADVGNCEGEGRITGVRAQDGALLVILPASDDAPAGVREVGYLVQGNAATQIANP